LRLGENIKFSAMSVRFELEESYIGAVPRMRILHFLLGFSLWVLTLVL